jgi:hypothetical protein
MQQIDGLNVSVLDGALKHQYRDKVIDRSAALIFMGRPGIENETCVRLRLRDTLLYRRPLIVDSFGASGQYVLQRKIGVVAQSLNIEDIRAAVVELMKPDVLFGAMRAIDAERERCVVDDNITPFVKLGEVRGWKPYRSAALKMTSQRAPWRTNGAILPALGV